MVFPELLSETSIKDVEGKAVLEVSMAARKVAM
jgi:hypothetical protein